jgi:DNA-directed RNA polymerase subunit RPC12/RpoP
MTPNREITKEDWIRTAIYLSLFVAALVIGAVLLLPDYWYGWLLLVVGGILLLVRWHAAHFAYRCPQCGHEFEITTFTDLISLQGPSRGGGWKYLKCPRCHARSRATQIKKIRE